MFVFSRLLKELRLDCTVKNGAKISPSFFFHRSTIFSPVNWSVFFFFFLTLYTSKTASPLELHDLNPCFVFFFSLVLSPSAAQLSHGSSASASLTSYCLLHSTDLTSVVVSRGQGLSSHSCCFLSVKERVFFFFFGKSTNLQNIKKKSLSWPWLCLSAVDTCPEVII